MTPRRARYTKIDKLVDLLLDSNAIEDPPVPIEDLLRLDGIDIQSGDLGQVSGLIVRGDGGVMVGVNSKQAPARRRFTMAHEYGHFLLHEGVLSHADENFRINYRDAVSSQASNVDEIEANYFAASLLMPKRFLDEVQAAEKLDDSEGVADLATKFGVSPLAMSLRLANLYQSRRPF